MSYSTGVQSYNYPATAQTTGVQSYNYPTTAQTTGALASGVTPPPSTWTGVLYDLVYSGIPNNAAACYTDSCIKYNKNNGSHPVIAYAGGSCYEYKPEAPYYNQGSCNSGICTLDNQPCITPNTFSL